MKRAGAHFPERLARLGVPEEVAGGFGPGGPFWALVDGSTADLRAYFEGGEASGARPSVYFDPAYYKALNPDWPEAGTALAHYLLCRLRGEERAAHPLFDAADYAAAYPDLAEADQASLLHFAQYGDAECRAPSRKFDPGFYQRVHMPLETGRPLRHFVTEGRDWGASARRSHRTKGDLSRRIARHGATSARPVLVLLHDLRQAGAPMLMLSVTRALIQRGWQPMVLGQEGGPLMQAFRALCPVVILADGWDLTELADVSTDVPVLASTVHCADLTGRLAPGRKAVLIVQEMPDYWHSTGLENDLITAARNGAQVVMHYDAMSDAFRALAPGVDCISLRPGLDPTPVSCGDRLARFRMLRGAGPVILGAGFADQRKGFDRFIDTATSIHAQHPQARFVWLGQLGAWAQGLADQARARGLPLELPGFVPDAIAWYAAADLFLLCSRQDPGPTVLADAVLQGAPFVGFDSDIGLRAHALRYGTLVPDDDIRAAARAALRVLADDTAADRRARRRRLAAETGFAPYVDQIEALLAPR